MLLLNLLFAHPADVDNFVRNITGNHKKTVQVISGFTERNKYIIRVLLKFRCFSFLFHSYYDLMVSGLLRNT